MRSWAFWYDLDTFKGFKSSQPWNARFVCTFKRLLVCIFPFPFQGKLYSLQKCKHVFCSIFKLTSSVFFFYFRCLILFTGWGLKSQNVFDPFGCNLAWPHHDPTISGTNTITFNSVYRDEGGGRETVQSTLSADFKLLEEVFVVTRVSILWQPYSQRVLLNQILVFFNLNTCC